MKIIIFVLICVIHEIAGHGMMLDPPGRSSMWRFNFPVEPNYSDNENFCGGAYTQNVLNGGKCGVCGDNYVNPHPQNNENTGLYGTGIVGKTYQPGEIIETQVYLTANHLGSFTYSLCKIPDVNAPEPEECFNDLLLEDGSAFYNVLSTDTFIINRIQLPDITCERCVLRWTYKCGNNWGPCDDNVWRQGCGPQEHFRSCADISILAPEPAPELVPEPATESASEPAPEPVTEESNF